MSEAARGGMMGTEVSGRVSRIPGGARPPARAGDRAAPGDGDGRCCQAGTAAGWSPPEDYVFEGSGADGTPTDVRLSELFAPGKDSLVIYSFMFPRDPGDERPGPASGQTALLPLEEGPCPSCVALLDQLEGAAEHVKPAHQPRRRREGSAPRILTFADERGWRRLRLLSSAGNTFNRDYLGETEEGAQRPMLNVFHRDGESIRHFWGSELFYAPTDPGQDPRHVGTLEPLWNLFDLTPEGRPSRLG